MMKGSLIVRPFGAGNLRSGTTSQPVSCCASPEGKDAGSAPRSIRGTTGWASTAGATSAARQSQVKWAIKLEFFMGAPPDAWAIRLFISPRPEKGYAIGRRSS
jgi:hypothetical protein